MLTIIVPATSAIESSAQAFGSADAYPHFNAIRDGRSDHGIVATLLGRCDRVILELSLVGFLSPLARKFDTYP